MCPCPNPLAKTLVAPLQLGTSDKPALPLPETQRTGVSCWETQGQVVTPLCPSTGQPLGASFFCLSDDGDNSQPAGVDARFDADCHDIPLGSVSCHGARCWFGVGFGVGFGFELGVCEGSGAKGVQGTELQLHVRLGTLAFVSQLASSWCVSPTPQPFPR